MYHRFSPFSFIQKRGCLLLSYAISLRISWVLLRQECGAGTEHFDSERYQREREGFGSTIMGWRSTHTIDVYDHSRDGEQTLHILAKMQHQLAQRRYLTPCDTDPTAHPRPQESACSITPRGEQDESN